MMLARLIGLLCVLVLVVGCSSTTAPLERFPGDNVIVVGTEYDLIVDTDDSGILSRVGEELLVPVPGWWPFGEKAWYFTFGH